MTDKSYLLPMFLFPEIHMLLICFVAFFATAGVGFADGKPLSPSDKLAAIKKQHEEAQAAYRDSMREIPDTPEGEKKSAELWKTFDKSESERFLAAVEIAKSEPKSDVGFEALEWILTIPRSYYLPAGIPAMELVTKHYATNPKVAKIVAILGRVTPDERGNPKEHSAAMALIKLVAEKNPDRVARGQAALALAYQKLGHFAVAEYKCTPDVDRLAEEAEKAYEGVIKDYYDCAWLYGLGKRTIGDQAKQVLHELQHLRIGKPAPEIEAEVVDGSKFKLTDHRGKIVVVVFWASWCGPCMAMVPHERELFAKMKDRPFALIGVNGDASRVKAKEVMTKEKMVWPSFWDGPSDGGGEISREWNVQGWPTVYVLDNKGMIRFKNLRAEELEKAVEQLLKDLEQTKK
jgi:peroxiredoxin